jgi:HK97 family phage major capsid protein
VALDVARRLHEQELGLWEQVKALHEVQVAENRSLTPDEQVRYGNLHTEIDSLDKRKREIMEDEKRMAAATTAYADFGSRAPVAGAVPVERRFNEEVRKVWKRESEGFAIPAADSRLIRRLSSGRPVNPTEVRTILDNYIPGGTPGSFTNPSGAGIVPIDFYDQIISYLVEVSGIMQTGPTVLNTQGGEPIQMPVVSLHTGQLTGANQYANLSAQQAAPLQAADPVFSQKTLTANKFGILVQVPRELLDDTGVNLLGYLATSAGRSLGNIVGNVLVNGGSGITGPLLTQAPVAVTGVAAISGTAASANGVVEGGPRYQDLVTLQYSVIAPYRQSRSCYWLAADQSLGQLRLLTDNVGRPIWEPSTILGAPDLLLGKPIVADPFMPLIGVGNKSVAFGDFSQYAIRLVGDMRFERSDDFAFGTDLVSFRAVIRVDANLLNPPTNITRSQPVMLFQGGAT